MKSRQVTFRFWTPYPINEIKLHVLFLKLYNFLSIFQKVFFLLLSYQNFQKGEKWLRGSWIFSPLRVLLCIIFSQTILVLILWSQPNKHFIPHCTSHTQHTITENNFLRMYIDNLDQNTKTFHLKEARETSKAYQPFKQHSDLYHSHFH